MRKGTGKSLLKVFGCFGLVGLVLLVGSLLFVRCSGPVAEYLCDEYGACGAVESSDDLDETMERLRD